MTENITARSSVNESILNSPDFQAAKKAMDLEAAKRIVSKLWSTDKTEALKNNIENKHNSVLLTVPSTSQKNILPVILADKLSRVTGIPYEVGERYFEPLHDREVKFVSRSDKPFYQREYKLINKAGFEKDLKGKSIIVVDDLLTTGGSAKTFLNTLSQEGVKPSFTVALMGDKRLVVDYKTIDSLSLSLKRTGLNFDAKEIAGQLTRTEAGIVIMDINNARSENAKQKLAKNLQGLLDRRAIESMGRDRDAAGDYSGQRGNFSHARVSEGIPPRNVQGVGGSQKNINSLDQQAELDRFKSGINLAEYAGSKGYEKDKRESSRNSLVMRNVKADDKIIIKQDADGHYEYFSVRNRSDNGTIIDFIQNRENKNLGEIRKELRPWIGRESTVNEYKIEPAGKKDRATLKNEIENTKAVDRSKYLEGRAISQETINDPRFKGMIREDSRHNTIFPHRDQNGVSGAEIKSVNFTGFTGGGTKGVWHSKATSTDRRLVITESAIDALSYHQVKPDNRTRYLSIGGGMSSGQERIVQAAIRKMPSGAEIIAATDNDRAGKEYAEKFKSLTSSDKTFKYDPPTIGKDWNDQLQELSKKLNREKPIERQIIR